MSLKPPPFPTDAPSARSSESDDGAYDRSERLLPDEDGPHDVPDETVIEKTLPTGPVNTGA